MDIEATTQGGNKKKFLIIALVVVFVAALAVGYRYYQSGDTMAPETLTPTPPNEPTEAEKFLRSQVEALDKIAEDQAQGIPQPMPKAQDQAKKLDAIGNQTPKQKAPGATTQRTAAQQAEDLDALQPAVNK